MSLPEDSNVDYEAKGGVVLEELNCTPTVDDAKHDDLARDLYEEALQMDPYELDRAAKMVLRKLDFIVLPMVSPFSALRHLYVTGLITLLRALTRGPC